MCAKLGNVYKYDKQFPNLNRPPKQVQKANDI